jgi:hypothetical protein
MTAPKAPLLPGDNPDNRDSLTAAANLAHKRGERELAAAYAHAAALYAVATAIAASRFGE